MAKKTDGFVRVALRQSSYDQLNAIATKNHVTKASLLEDMINHIDSDSAISISDRLKRIEECLEQVTKYVETDHDLVTSMDQVLARKTEVLPGYPAEVTAELHDIEKTRRQFEAAEQTPEYKDWIKRVREGKASYMFDLTKNTESDPIDEIMHRKVRKNSKASKDSGDLVTLPKPDPKNLRK
jgi:galactose-1-phosphate uridylyltransferase